MALEELIDQIFRLQDGDDAGFASIWQTVFQYQRKNNLIYNRYCKSLDDADPPFLPIEAFKHAPITTFDPSVADLVFKSSGTGSGAQAVHHVKDRRIYERASSTHFERLLGGGPMTLLAHLPHYAEMGSASSLLYMVAHFVEVLGDEYSGSFLNDDALLKRAIESQVNKIHSSSIQPFVLFGAAFGLLDMVERQSYKLPDHAIVIETGGMKTYRREISRQELHEKLAMGFGLPRKQVWSEYGMCELLSQCYARGGPIFQPPPWMRIQVMNPENPLEVQSEDMPGALAVIDLANLHSVSAILTQDRAIKCGTGFEVLGRLSGTELRGCNFLLEQAQG